MLRRLCVSAVLAAMTLWMSPAHAGLPPRFPPGSVWHQDIQAAAVHPQSASMLAALAGWGNGDRMQIDFSFNVRRLQPGDAYVDYPVVAHAAYADYYLPDCEPEGTSMPVPADAAFEGENGLSCDNTAGDCHLLVERNGLLYELYSGNLSGGQLDALCLAVWDLNVAYPEVGRGDHCTSADAAGFPIAPLMPSPDEVAAAVALTDGDLGHAIRFILPNAKIATTDPSGGGDPVYVRPATHAGGPSGPAATVPYGVRMRLRADFPMAGYNPAAQVILRTMQRYGIVLADGGNIALTFASDRHNATTWDALGIDAHVFWNGSAGNRTPVKVGDFAVIDTGPRIVEDYNCVRSAVVPGGRIFGDGFEGGAG